MKVLITTGIYPPDIGGPATYVPRIASALRDQGMEVEVVTLSDTQSGADSPIGNGSAVHRISRSLPVAVRSLALVWRMVRAGRGASIIYANGLYLQSALAGWILGVPLVAKIVGDPVWERARNRGWTALEIDPFQTTATAGWCAPVIRVLRYLRNWSLHRAENVIVPSQYLGSIVRGWGIPGERVAVIYNGIDFPERTSGAERSREASSCATSLHLITVARLAPWKGVDRLIELIAHVPQYRLSIVGDGPLRERLEREVSSRGISDRVRFLGRCSHRDTLNCVAASDVFVLLSRYEGLPHVLLEATSLGIPVVSLDAGGCTEAVMDGITGRIVADDSWQVVQRAIEEVRNLELPRRPLSEEVRGFLGRFEESRMFHETSRILSTLAHAHGRTLHAEEGTASK